MLALLSLVASAWTVLGPDAAPTDGTIDPTTLFVPGEPPAERTAVGDADALKRVATRTACTLASLHDAGSPPAMLGELGITRTDIERTLAFVAAASPEELADSAFLAEHFRAWSWRPDQAGARARDLSPPADRIRLTRYLVYQVDGSAERTATFTHALYAVPDDEAHLDEDAAAGATGLLRHRLHPPPGARRRVRSRWGSRGQGPTARVGTSRRRSPGAHAGHHRGAPGRRPTRRLFNVHRSNGIPYVPTQRDQERQDRFWYFREVEGPMGWGSTPDRRIPLEYGVTVAGDVYNLGAGGLFALSHPTRSGAPGLRLAVLADTGGAFQPNLFQLDLLAGAYPHPRRLHRRRRPHPVVCRRGSARREA